MSIGKSSGIGCIPIQSSCSKLGDKDAHATGFRHFLKRVGTATKDSQPGALENFKAKIKEKEKTIEATMAKMAEERSRKAQEEREKHEEKMANKEKALNEKAVQSMANLRSRNQKILEEFEAKGKEEIKRIDAAIKWKRQGPTQE